VRVHQKQLDSYKMQMNSGIQSLISITNKAHTKKSQPHKLVVCTCMI